MPIEPTISNVKTIEPPRFPSWQPLRNKVGYGVLFLLAIFYVLKVAASIYFDYHGGRELFDMYDRPIGSDFINWWTAAHIVLEGNVAMLFDADRFHAFQESLFHHVAEYRNWPYPPHVLPWLMWLGAFPYLVAFGLWTALTFAGYAFAVAYKRPQPWTIVLILLLAPSTIINAVEGQTGFLAAALLVGGLRLLERSPRAAGILFGFLTFKVQYGIMVPIALLAGGHWRTIGAAMLTTMILVVLSFLMFGFGPWHDYIVLAVPYQREILEYPIVNEPFQLSMISPFTAARFLSISVHASYNVTIVAGLVAILGMAYVFLRTRSPDLRAVAVIAATFLTSPYFLSYDTPAISAAIIAFIMVAHAGEKRLRPAHYVLFGLIWFLPLIITKLNKERIVIYPLAPLTLLIVAAIWSGQPPFKERVLAGLSLPWKSKKRIEAARDTEGAAPNP